ncbi:MAG: hypothetical protein ACREUZ_15775, partial [Burkholderiales bacterium]
AALSRLRTSASRLRTNTLGIAFLFGGFGLGDQPEILTAAATKALAQPGVSLKSIISTILLLAR